MKSIALLALLHFVLFPSASWSVEVKKQTSYQSMDERFASVEAAAGRSRKKAKVAAQVSLYAGATGIAFLGISIAALHYDPMVVLSKRYFSSRLLQNTLSLIIGGSFGVTSAALVATDYFSLKRYFEIISLARELTEFRKSHQGEDGKYEVNPKTENKQILVSYISNSSDSTDSPDSSDSSDSADSSDSSDSADSADSADSSDSSDSSKTHPQTLSVRRAL